MPLDQRLLRIAVARQGERVLVKQVRPFIKLDFETKKEQFMTVFNEHPVTQEIEEGPKAFSRQQELANTGGNLFSLLGFYAEQHPIADLREYLVGNVVLYKTHAGQVRGDKVTFDTEVLAPSEEEINSWMANDPGTSLEWTGRSWTELLARGVSGLPSYLFDLTRDFSRVPSRSGPAIQVKGNLRSTQLGPIPYIRSVLSSLTQIITPRK